MTSATERREMYRVTLNVYVSRQFDGVKPSRVEAVVLAKDRYEAEAKVDIWRDEDDRPFIQDDPDYEVAEAMESDNVEDVFVV